MNLFNRTHKGFTLIELLVVVSIISLLSSIVMASLNTARAKARDTKRLADLQQMNTAIQLYINDNNAAPLLGSGEPASYRSSDLSQWNQLEAALTSYIPSLPQDPCPTCDFYPGSDVSYGSITNTLPGGGTIESQTHRYIYYSPGNATAVGEDVNPTNYYLFSSGFEKRAWSSFGFFFGSGTY
jgi:prepilin-type N-terminal cleavage/methylation domain-containing protein